MIVNFVKMHGLGNDFVVIDHITQNIKLYAAQIKRIAHRQLGVGCDQLLMIEPPVRKEAHFYYRVFNANGQEVEQCGNGARCAARYFYDSGYVDSNHLKADCLAGSVEFKVFDDEVLMSIEKPKFEPKDIPFAAKEAKETREIREIRETRAPNEGSDIYSIPFEGNNIEFSVVSIGNPHAVLLVPNVETAPVKKIGPLLAKHPFFPNQTNVDFMQIVDRSHILLRVWERGVGETMACGTGACAAAVTGINLGWLDNPVLVEFPYGKLKIDWPSRDANIQMTGPAINVFVGRFRL